MVVLTCDGGQTEVTGNTHSLCSIKLGEGHVFAKMSYFLSDALEHQLFVEVHWTQLSRTLELFQDTFHHRKCQAYYCLSSNAYQPCHAYHS